MMAAEVMKPHRRWGMTRPWFLILLLLTVGMTVMAAVVAGSLLYWLAWSIGGVFVGATLLTFDAKKRR